MYGTHGRNLTSLVECGVFEKDALAVSVFEHTLRGLKRLAEDGIIHRDIKPDNILYTTKNNVYHFKIGDFGIANYEVFAETLVGTRIYLAPEMNSKGMCRLYASRSPGVSTETISTLITEHQGKRPTWQTLSGVYA